MALSRRGPMTLLASLLVTLVSSCTPSPAGPPFVSQAPSATPAQEACGPIALVTPSGNRVDLTGTWQGAQTILYVRQVGSCVWWVAQSDVPGADLGAQAVIVFRGDLSSDFTLSGEWMEVVRLPALSGAYRGSVTFEIETETVAGSEALVLRSTMPETDGNPYGYGAATLTKVGPLPAGEFTQ